jgi:HEAT repeat protein
MLNWFWSLFKRRTRPRGNEVLLYSAKVAASFSQSSSLDDLRNESLSIDRRREACKLTGTKGNSAAVEPLIRLLDNPGLAVSAIEALAEIGDERAVKPILLKLAEYGKVGETASSALKTLGWTPDPEEEEQVLLNALACNDVLTIQSVLEDAPGAARMLFQRSSLCDHRIRLAQILGESKSPFVFGMLSDVLSKGVRYGNDAKVASALKAATAKLVHNFGAEDLEWLLRCGSTVVKLAAIEHLGEKLGPAATLLLVEALKDPDRSVQESAATALGESNDPRAALPLVEIVREGVYGLNHVAERALRRLGPHSVEALVAAIETDTCHRTTDVAVEIFKSIGTAEMVRPLRNIALRSQGAADALASVLSQNVHLVSAELLQEISSLKERVDGYYDSDRHEDAYDRYDPAHARQIAIAELSKRGNTGMRT